MSNKIVLLSNSYFEGVFNLPIFDIEYIDLNFNITKYDALIFTSKNAIYSLDKSKLNWKGIESYVIAPKTAEVLKKYNANLVFTGVNSHGNEFANELIPLLKNKKTLYIRGEKSVSNLFTILKESGVDIEEQIAYRTVCSNQKIQTLNNNSIIIFTSPSSVNCFFKNYSWQSTYKAIAIGNTTAKFLPQNVEVYISDVQSIESCISLAKQIS